MTTERQMMVQDQRWAAPQSPAGTVSYGDDDGHTDPAGWVRDPRSGGLWSVPA